MLAASGRVASQQIPGLHRLRELGRNGPATTVLSMFQMPPDALLERGLSRQLVLFMPGLVELQQFHGHSKVSQRASRSLRRRTALRPDFVLGWLTALRRLFAAVLSALFLIIWSFVEG